MLTYWVNAIHYIEVLEDQYSSKTSFNYYFLRKQLT